MVVDHIPCVSIGCICLRRNSCLSYVVYPFDTLGVPFTRVDDDGYLSGWNVVHAAVPNV